MSLNLKYGQGEAENVRIAFGLLRGPRLLPASLEIDINGDVATTMQLGGRPNDRIEIDRIEAWPDVVDVEISESRSAAVNVNQQHIDNAWVPFVDLKVQCRSGPAEVSGQSGLMKVFLKDKSDPMIARLNFVDRQRFSCFPDSIWLDKQPVQRRNLVITGLNDLGELIST